MYKTFFLLERKEEIEEEPSPAANYKGLEEGKTTLNAVFTTNSSNIGEIKKAVNRAVNEKAAEKKLFQEK